MGHLDDPADTFWQMFVRPAGTTSWSLVTPPGVADNGGLVMTTGAVDTATVGFEPSQDLLFSPLAQTSDLGSTWSPDLLPKALALGPDALAGSGTGSVFAIERSGGGSLVSSSNDFGTWRTVVSQGELAATSGARPCTPSSLTAVTLDAAGNPLFGVACEKKGVVGIFAESDGHWVPVGPQLDPGLLGSPTSVLRLVTTASGVSSLVGVGGDAHSDIVAAWSASPSAHVPWTMSTPLSVGPSDQVVSTGVGADGGFVVLVKRSDGALDVETVAGSGSTWQRLEPAPPGTETVADGPDGTVDAFSVDNSQLTDWVLSPSTGSWQKTQTITVPIEYGSSS